MNYKIIGAAVGIIASVAIVALVLLSTNKESTIDNNNIEYIETASSVIENESRIKYVMSDAKRLAATPVNGTINEKVDEKDSTSELTIYVGDSRTVGMESVMDNGEIIIAKIGEGYGWYKSSAEDKLIAALNDNSDKTISVIFNLGVNDLHNAQKYVEAINELSKAYPDVGFSYMSVNPVETTTVSNNQINTFNDTIKKMLDDSVSYIDAFTYLVDNGYDTVDGLHYTKETYKDIYDFVCETTM